MQFKIDLDSTVPVYKQLVAYVEDQIRNNKLSDGTFLPSMNVLSAELGISKETVKKAYSILREMEYIDASQGKGFYIKVKKNINDKVLVIFDKLSTYKLITYQSFKQSLGKSADINIILHEQDIKLFAQMVESNLELYDYFVISANFKLEPSIQKQLIRILKKIPNRKLLLLDQLVPSLPGNYGVIYQDFENDAYHALTDNKELIKKYRKINIVTSPNSLYYSLISKGILKFCNENEMNFACFTKFNASDIKADEIYIILNRQLDQELIDILKTIKDKKIVLGKEVGVISYNESPINEFIMNGLTVLSTDFYEMGKWAGEMIKNKSLKKIRNRFELIVRETL